MSRTGPSVLLLSRHYPPTVSAGARRPLLLARGLSACGARVHVVAPQRPPGTPGLTVPAGGGDGTERAAAAARSRPVRTALLEHFSLPDPELRWALRAARATERWAKAEGRTFDWVVTTSPPESLHVVGARLGRRLNAGWVADLRDRWLEAPLLRVRRKPWRQAAERPLAAALLRRADLITATDPPALAEVQRLAPGVPTHLTPQASPDRSVRAPTRSGSVSNGPVTVLHTGSFSLSHEARRIEPALDLLRRAKAIDPRFVLRLVGRLTPAEAAQAEGAGAFVSPALSLEETWAAQAEADVLLLVAAPGSDAVPGKLAEYRAAGGPIVVLGGGAWRKALPGTELEPLELLMRLRDPARRADFAAAPGPSPEEAARGLLAAMRAARPW